VAGGTGERRYWSIEHCGWVVAPGVEDALATPWSAHGLPLPDGGPPPRDAYDVLRWSPPLPGLPGQRPAAERPAVGRPAPTPPR
jgi:hypothetical protein